MHQVWRKVRKPFRYPSCRACTWEAYDAQQAGCLKCGRHHFCHANAVDNTCPLIMCDDRTRVCQITGFVLPEVRHAASEFCDTTHFSDKPPPDNSLNREVTAVVYSLLTGERARRCRENENARQYTKLSHHLYRQMRVFKALHPNRLPCVCQLLSSAIQQERYWRFIEQAGEDLIEHCAETITNCLRELRLKGSRMIYGSRLREMVCGMLYMLKHGLTYRDRILLQCIPEVDRCLPHENKIEAYFGISSKVICMTENEVKLVFRETYQI
jgi:hypothetical protein